MKTLLKLLIAVPIYILPNVTLIAGEGISPTADVFNLPHGTHTCGFRVVNKEIFFPRGQTKNSSEKIMFQLKVAATSPSVLGVGRELFFSDGIAKTMEVPPYGYIKFWFKKDSAVESLKMNFSFDVWKGITVQEFEELSINSDGLNNLEVFCREDEVVKL